MPLHQSCEKKLWAILEETLCDKKEVATSVPDGVYAFSRLERRLRVLFVRAFYFVEVPYWT